MGVSLTVNRTPVEVRVDGTTSLILALRNELGLKGSQRQPLLQLTFPFCRRMSCPTQPVPMSR
jgi:hypothetical protein